jgi:prepilin-type N-terminal cleavage/methylation domain-containing protein
MKCFGSRRGALTLIEVIIVVAVLAVLAFLFLSRPRGVSPERERIACIGNLKQIGVSMAVWEVDHGNRFPMQVSTNEGGTRELVGVSETFRHFQVMSNELGSPVILVCPSDKERKAATNFTSDINDTRISYFLGVDATQTNVNMFLAGDRNITNGLPTVHRILTLTTNRPAGWTEKIHVNSGNIVLSDFSGQQLNTPGLRTSLEATGVPTNRLAMP